MTKSGIRNFLACAGISSLALVATGAVAQDEGASDDTLSQLRANVISNAGELASLDRGNSSQAIRSFLRSRGFGVTTAGSATLVKEHFDKQGRRFAAYEQRINGLRVHGAYARLAFDRNNAPIHAMERFATISANVSAAGISEETALNAAITEHFNGQVNSPGRSGSSAGNSNAKVFFEKGTFFYTEPSVERVIIARGAKGQGGLAEGFLVETWSQSDNMLYETVVDGRGRVISSELRTATQDTYSIFPDHPGNSSQTVVSGPGAGNAQSPSGWLAGNQSTQLIQGNNVRAYLDVDANNAPDGGGVPVGNSSFTTSANLAQDPTTTDNRNVAVQNLFYYNNVIHDRLYIHGFTEAAGNFQENNFGNGGAGSDSVNAEAQDGGGFNNANFATPSDGSNPRMQMFLWDLTSPFRDGDLDSDIIWHEYGHGLTWRMIGSMSGDISGAIGEGMADTLAIIINNDDAVGEYSANRSAGIRSSRYGSHQDTIGDFDSNRGVHRNGEIYGATMWDLRTLYLSNGFTDNDLLDDLVGGMNFTPSGPDYFDMRNGILAQAPADRTCLVWEAFAGRGMGDGGSMGGRRRISVTQSFSLPAECDDTPPPPPPVEVDAALANLSGSASSQGRNRWSASVTASVIDNATGSAASNVTVSGTWSTGDSGSCTTDTSGSCSATLSGLRTNRVSSVTFTVNSIAGDANANGVGTSVTINRP
ncbi:M36 family metallopeptidase [Kordiimonas sp. SCSIO 12610]|uniref:M36 family metallopeptidase n=1 Tax=Kordiimonas sp. SCSIO 12610 TaxID=2829597 RepID=UPI002109076B|nr:M36 family metallopeptidase [Kordiimonas sp. SCSIO 12610]UTW56222.1 M36 family metallopeptidase [Kordiimonas sp. SCSIO 12610]